MNRSFLPWVFTAGAAFLGSAHAKSPHIVYILADDLGYGDVQCLNPAGKIATPNIDRLASQGMLFTDAHSSSSVCTPSRYSILTGRYNWRTHLQSGVPGGFAKPLISPNRMTVASLLKSQGYATACFGKWHLGLTLPDKNHLNEQIKDTPLSRGFDEFFGICASLDMPPYSFIDNDHFSPPIDTEKSLFMDRVGPAAEKFEAIDVLPILTQKAESYIRDHASAEKPFFLYLPLTAPHTPLVPSKEWQGKSGLGDYGDFVMQTDATVGTIMTALEESGIAGNTLLIVTSDNGCAPMAGVKQLKAQGHHPSAQFRGLKSDIWEGGHRLPFIVRWPDQVKAGSTCEALVSLGDLMATCADLLEVKLPESAGEDSISILPLLRGKTDTAPRTTIVHHSNNGSFAIREGSWKLELCPGSGGWGNPNDLTAIKRGLPAVQLYDLSKDLSETTNLEAEHPEVVAHLRALLEQQIADGRSTPGKKQPNDAKIVVEKFIGR